MKDTEIIKALECCLAKTLVDDECEQCPYLAAGAYCMDKLINDALDLINRQKAEIEEQDQAIIKALKHMGEIRSEAIKEFAEKLKEHYFWDLEQAAIFEEDIDNFVKEMTEGADK